MFSGWAVLYAVLLLMTPVLMATFAALDDSQNAPSDLHRGAQFTHGSLGPGSAGIVGASLVPLAIIGAIALAPARPGATIGRLAAFGALTLAAWTIPVLFLGGITVGPSIVLPVLIGTLILALEIGAWVGLASLATTARRIHPLLVAVGIMVALAVVASVVAFLPYIIPAYRDLRFDEIRLVTQRWAWLTPDAASRALANAMFPGNAGFFDPSDVEVQDQAFLFSPWTWGVVALAWAAVPALVAMGRERGMGPEHEAR